MSKPKKHAAELSQAKEEIIFIAKLSEDMAEDCISVMRRRVATLKIDENLFEDILDDILENPVSYPSHLKKVIDDHEWAKQTAAKSESSNKIARDAMIASCDSEMNQLENKYRKDEWALRNQLRKLKINHVRQVAIERTKIDIIKCVDDDAFSDEAHLRVVTFLQEELIAIADRESRKKQERIKRSADFCKEQREKRLKLA